MAGRSTFRIFEDENLHDCIQRLRSYREVNVLCLGYKNQLINAVLENNSSSEIHTKHIHTYIHTYIV